MSEVMAPVQMELDPRTATLGDVIRATGHLAGRSMVVIGRDVDGVYAAGIPTEDDNRFTMPGTVLIGDIEAVLERPTGSGLALEAMAWACNGGREPTEETRAEAAAYLAEQQAATQTVA